ncbi:acetyl-CoA carboxylase biotin carboxylase subunit [Piscinibacter koreensis]|uniref:Propionyl-CoA carboxylase alpha chain, mitochondrial n=1 Tax=Piscinibacter koreensis TaxID=2742824 RepID=A0A7Y6TYG5_9BURK|nr:acetyl/propionyl/methylcrotonyl-CoA carboxylase subunit alpha [Schlegelella koreensis]NUZ08179.1 acetyl/propionyl/methylcrotonyl-CoA carboxylase subunit alpha [Schlegelella koreensis]
MFKKILIANRGEIACRVIKTARKMGIATVAVYSEADRDALHRELADESVCIGPAPSRASYLNADAILDACRQTGAEAIHPGYGFLSENAEFAKRVEDEGFVFIGPKHRSIAAMGDKIESKKLAAAAKVNTIPGYNEAIDTPEHAVEIARGIGYPVMIKASAGGGGKGLRVAWNDQDAHAGFTSCRNEARASFGDDRVFIEKFVEEPRHIEIQVLGDAHGNCVYLWERECSIQRRHQKVIEEAPSPFVDDELRRAMGEQAVALARAVDYQSAGTVEFVVGSDRRFFFLEMNTRLQVEHPVTESITGLDLVEQMIRVAAGEPLGFAQADVRRDGWSIECRINAEDPLRGFLPSTGRLVTFRPPAQTLFAAGVRSAEAEARDAAGAASSDVDAGATTARVRVDTGVYEGGEIPIHYDSMICKLIVDAPDRLAAIAGMRDALNGFVIRGVASNIGFQAALLAHPRFVAGDFDTGFIAAEYPEGFTLAAVRHADPDFLAALAVAVNRRVLARSAGISGQLPGHELQVGERFVVVECDTEGKRRETAASVRMSAEGYDVTIAGRSRRIVFTSPLRDVATVGTVDGKPFRAQIERNGLSYRVIHNGAQADLRVLSPRAAELNALMPFKAPPDLSKFLLSPMPGLLVDVAVEPGQAVRPGERLAVIEAMKMENILVASHAGVVAAVRASKGESLAVDQVILEFE